MGTLTLADTIGATFDDLYAEIDKDVDVTVRSADVVSGPTGDLRDATRRLGQTIVMVTHDPVAAAYADRVVFLADGRVVDELQAPTAERVLDRMMKLEG